MTALPRLATERLVLRPFVPADGPKVEELAGAWEVAHTTLTIPHPYPVGGAAGWIEGHATAWNEKQHLTLAICLGDATDEIIGAIALRLELEHAHGELGYWIGAAMWGRGYATEAARAVTAFGFGSLGLHRILARHFVRNPASGRVMQKLHMRIEGVHRDAYRRFGQFENVAVYGVLDSEWEQAERGNADDR
jgi:RimJ/RimL family protein N-acetyltransferase